MRIRALLDWLLPVVVLITLTIPFWTTDLDMSVASHFYSPAHGWDRGGEQPWKALYHYGVIPAWIVAVSALVVFVASFRATSLRRHRRAAIFLVLAMAIGPGLMVNVVFKDHWGRPRPRDVREFGGDRSFVGPWIKKPAPNGNAFASGHASMGFFLMVPYFLCRRRRWRRAVFFVALGLGYGGLMGWARMTQGAHFLSDVLWALGFVYLSALGVFYALRLNRGEGPAPAAPTSSG